MVPPQERRPRWRDTHTGILILVMFLICAPTLQRLLSCLSGVVTDDIIPDIVDDPGPFELPNNICTTTKGTDTMSSSPVHIPSRSPSPSDTDSYDRLSDISPHSSPAMAHSAKWSGGSIVSDDHFTTTTPIPVVETPIYKTEIGTGTKRPDVKVELPPRFPVLPTEAMIQPNSATAPQPVDTMPWNRNSFSNPAIQEKLRQQSVLYHQIHDLLAEHLGTRNKSVVEENNRKFARNLDRTRTPLSPIPEPTYKVEGVDHAKIQALKNKYPNKLALHKHLDTFSAIMSRFMALSAPDVSVLDLKDPVSDEKKSTPGRETDRARRSPRPPAKVDRTIVVIDSPTLPPAPRTSWQLADIPEEKLIDGV
ncbi:hypothetical protein TWF506_010937 [Arthrobotrys conoides]|uniref:Uncharacterized protein n=1 Tax=Arthrobotrys conoides TaxID=74498 RepID=A0AAN8RTD3_9PEZI